MIWTAVLVSAALAATAPAAKPAKHKTAEVADPADPMSAGIAAFRAKKFARAEADFEKAVENDPKSAAAHFYLGYAIYKTAEPKHAFHPDKQKAAAEFAKAYEIDPTFQPDWGRGAAAKPKS